MMLAITLALGFRSLVYAEPLDRREISADAKWMAHIDLDAARAAKLVQEVYNEAISHDAAKRRLDALQRAVGMDLARDLHSISVYGTRFVPQAGVVIIRAKFDQARLLGLLKRAPDRKTSSHGKHELHTWADGKNKKQRITGCFYGPALAVAGQDTEEVKAALDVLDGQSPSLADGESLLGEAPADGVIFEARVIELAGAELLFKSPIVRQAEFFSIAIGESNGEVFGQARMVAKTADVAERVRAAAEGFRALAELQYGGNEDVVGMLEALKVSVADRTVTVTWRTSADDLLRLIEAEWAKLQKSKQAD